MKKPAVAGSQTQDTSGLSRQCSATEPQQPDNHQPSQSSICTAQVVLNTSVAHLAATSIFLYFCLITSKFIYLQREARFSEHYLGPLETLCLERHLRIGVQLTLWCWSYNGPSCNRPMSRCRMWTWLEVRLDCCCHFE